MNVKGISIPEGPPQNRGSITVSARTAEAFRRVAAAENRRRDTDGLLLDMIAAYVREAHPDWQTGDGEAVT